MVNDEGQLYTIEGIAASALILTTVYLVLTTTTVFTPAETHVYDMQLEQLGNDVLAVMDMSPLWNTTNSPYPKSPLETYVETNDEAAFRDAFRSLVNQKTSGDNDNIKLRADIFFQSGGNVINTSFSHTDEYYNENAVKVTRWVNVNIDNNLNPDLPEGNQTVLLEVLIWRG